MNIFVVILHYGPVEQTQRLHEQLLTSNTALKEKILVFDNASPIPYPGVWLRAERNLYWAGALERVMEILASHGASHVWFLNNDVVFTSKPPYLERATARLRRAEKLIGPVGIYAPAVTTNPYHPQMIVNPKGQFREVRYVDGIAPLISVNFWKQAGLDYAGNPYGYGVDLCFSLQARKFGFTCVLDHQVVLRHRYHSTARNVKGFLATAAVAEKAYLTQRLGPEYQDTIKRMAAETREFG